MKLRFSENAKDTILNTALVVSLLFATGFFLNSKTHRVPTFPTNGQNFSKGLDYLTVRDVRFYEQLRPIETRFPTSKLTSTQTLEMSTTSKSTALAFSRSHNQLLQNSELHIPSPGSNANLQSNIMPVTVETTVKLLGLPPASLEVRL